MTEYVKTPDGNWIATKTFRRGGSWVGCSCCRPTREAAAECLRLWEQRKWQ